MPRAARITLTVVALLLLIIGSAYAWRKYSYSAKVQALQQQFATTMVSAEGGRPRNREGFRAVRDQIKELPEQYQQQFREGMRDMFMQRMQQRMTEYLALDKDARRKELDKRIAEDEKRRKRWEAERKERAAQAAQNGQTNSSDNGNQGRGNGPGGGGPWGGGGGGRRGLSAFLDNTTPQMRAMMAEYRRDMEQRRRELGLPPSRHRW